MNIFDRLALEKDDDYWKTGPGYEVPKYPKGLANYMVLILVIF